MKTFKAIVKFWHESFGGYDQYDGQETRTVQARNMASAEKKLGKILDKETTGLSQCRWYKIVYIEEEET